MANLRYVVHHTIWLQQEKKCLVGVPNSANMRNSLEVTLYLASNKIDRNSGPFLGADVNEVSVCNVNDPMPTGQGDIGTILLSPFEDGR